MLPAKRRLKLLALSLPPEPRDFELEGGLLLRLRQRLRLTLLAVCDDFEGVMGLLPCRVKRSQRVVCDSMQ